MQNIIQINKNVIGQESVNSVNARDLWKALDVKRDFNAWMNDTKEILETYEEGEDYIRVTKDRNNKDVVVKKTLRLKGKQVDYIITLDMAKHIAMMSHTPKGKEVRKYFIQIEKQYRADKEKEAQDLQEILNDTDKFLDMAIKLRDERNKAIKEKAWIGTKREATAMATASKEKKRANKLQIILDESLEWASIKKVEIATGRKFKWRELKKISQQLNHPPRKVFDANYGEVNAYHRTVWYEFGVDLELIK